MTETLPTLAFIGAGSMGGAILKGVVDSGAAGEIRVSDPHPDRIDALVGQGVVTIVDASARGNAQAVRGASIVVLGVKPTAIREVLDSLGESLDPGTVLVSIAVGITTETLQALLPSSVRVVRTMPNLPVSVARGITAITPGSSADAEAVALTRRLFETVGDVLEVDENQMDAVASISGSGPAYVYYLVEAFTAAAEHQGFSREQASALAENTFRGALELLANSDSTPGQLRRQVTSPKGTTEAALGVLMHEGIDDVFVRATDAAVQRAEQLAAEA